MSEKPEKKPATTAEKKETTKKEGVSKGREEKAQVLKAEWTLERCTRYARRFPNESVWASASPASYKAAVAHGWKDACVAAMNTKKAA